MRSGAELLPSLGKPTVMRRGVALALLAAGAALAAAVLVTTPPGKGSPVWQMQTSLVIVTAAALLVALPAVHEPLARGLDRLRQPSPGQRRFATVAIWVVASLYLAFTAWRQGRNFLFKTQDEFMYLVQVQALARGRLWMPQHPMADFFEGFYFFVKPVTSGMYFPGAALMFVPIVWLHLPFAVMSLAICGGVVGMTYRVVTELVDGVAGGLAALLMLAGTTFRTLSLLTLSYMPMALLGLLIFWAYLHWRRKQCYGWAAILGALCGWAAITRPLDAIVFVVPVIVAMIVDISGEVKVGKKLLLTALIAGAAGAPFLAMQLALDKAVTGHFGKTPVQEYHDRYWPGTVNMPQPHMLPGEHHLASSLPQFEQNYRQFVLPHYRGKPVNRWLVYGKELQMALPTPLLAALIPLGAMAIGVRRRWALWLVLPLFPTAYVTWVMFIKWYAIVIAPVLMFAIVLGAQALVDAFPEGRAFLSTWLTAAIAALAVAHLPEMGHKGYAAGTEYSRLDAPTGSEVMEIFNRLARTEIRRPAVVFFRYHAEVDNLWKHEQTYNAEAAWFDDESIVRAHDIPGRDIELVRYYAERQPERTVYLFDQVTCELRELGNVAELARDPALLEERLAPGMTLPEGTTFPPSTTRPAVSTKAPVSKRRGKGRW